MVCLSKKASGYTISCGGGLHLKKSGRNCRKSEVYIAFTFGCVSSIFGSEGKYQRSLGMMSFLTFCLKSIEVITAAV